MSYDDNVGDFLTEEINDSEIKIIGISGKMTSGKTSIARFLEERIISSHILSFASLLKEIILKAGLCKKEELWGIKTDFSRLMLQKIGTDIIRNQIDENFWVKEMNKKIKNEYDLYDYKITIIIDDVRFKNEANYIKSFKNSILLKVNRPNVNINNFHRSETELDNFKMDFEIMNDGSLDDLREKSLMF